MGTTPEFELPYPDSTDPNDVPADMRVLAEQIEDLLMTTFAHISDPRFTNSRTPNGPAGGALSGFYPSPGIAAALLDAAAGTASLRTLGAGAQQAAPGNHRHYAADTDWAPFVLDSGWVQAGSDVPGYRRFNGLVFARGSVQCADDDTAEPAINEPLPVGFRSSYRKSLALHQPSAPMGFDYVPVLVDQFGVINKYPAAPSTNEIIHLDSIIPWIAQ